MTEADQKAPFILRAFEPGNETAAEWAEYRRLLAAGWSRGGDAIDGVWMLPPVDEARKIDAVFPEDINGNNTEISACAARLTAAEKTIDAMRQQWYSTDFHRRVQETIRAYDAACTPEATR